MENKTEKTAKSVRGKVNGYSSNTLWAKRSRKHAEADERQAKHDSLSVAEKLAKAKKMGGKRETARLQKLVKA